MAKAITQIVKEVPKPEVLQAQAEQEILQSLAKHKDSVLQLLELVHDLKEAGLLEMAHAFVSNRHQIGVIGINQLNKSGAQNMIKNGMGTLQFLARLQPDQLNLLFGALSSGIGYAAEKTETNERQGLWGLLKTMRRADIQRALHFMINLLRGMGGFLQRQAR